MIIYFGKRCCLYGSLYITNAANKQKRVDPISTNHKLTVTTCQPLSKAIVVHTGISNVIKNTIRPLFIYNYFKVID